MELFCGTKVVGRIVAFNCSLELFCGAKVVGCTVEYVVGCTVVICVVIC